jgi:DNA polymerase-1
MATRLFEPGAADVLYLVDLSGYVFRAYHAVPALTSPAGEPTHAVLGTVNMLERLLRQCRPALLAVAMDSRTPTFRKTMYEAYKANRPPPPPDLSQQMRRVAEIVEASGIPVLQEDGVEADDLIATAVRQAREERLRVVIVSADKDLMQLLGDDVLLWDTMRDRVVGPAEVTERFGVAVTQVRDLLALMGDSSDNVPGVPSVGPKTARELLLAHHDLAGIYANLESISRRTLRETLREHRAQAELSQKLVTLRTDCQWVLERDKLRRGGRDTRRLKELYTELGFQRLGAALEAEPAASPSGESPDSRAAAPSATASADPGETELVLELGVLERLVAEARQRSELALEVRASGPGHAGSHLAGIGVSTSPGRACYLPLGHRTLGGPRQLGLDEVRPVLGPLLDDPDVRKLGHDLKRARVLARRSGLDLAGAFFDPLLASYLLDPEAVHSLPGVAQREIGMVLANDDDLVRGSRGKTMDFDQVPAIDAARHVGPRLAAVWRLRERMVPRLADEQLGDLFDRVEMPLGSVLAELELTGVGVDTSRLGEIGRALERELGRLEADAQRIAGRPFNVNAPRQLETLLFDEFGLKPIKRTKTARSTDAETLEALSNEHELPRVILEIRQLQKLKGTYVDALPLLVKPETGRIHTSWEQAVTATGRLSSTDPNLQNIPIRSELGRSIREAFVAPPGHQLLSADYSQIELRILAHLSQDPALVEAFRSGDDIHVQTAMGVFDVSREAVTAEHRRRAKAVNFGIIYGQGDSGLAKSLGISRAEASNFISSEPDSFLKGSTASLTKKPSTRGSSSTPNSSRVLPAITCEASRARFRPVALLAYGTVREARGLTSSTHTISSFKANCTFIKPHTLSASPSCWVYSRMMP